MFFEVNFIAAPFHSFTYRTTAVIDHPRKPLKLNKRRPRNFYRHKATGVARAVLTVGL